MQLRVGGLARGLGKLDEREREPAVTTFVVRQAAHRGGEDAIVVLLHVVDDDLFEVGPGRRRGATAWP